MSFLSNERIFKRAAWITLFLVTPALSGALQAADALLDASQPPSWEGSAYELNAGSWVTDLSEGENLQDDHRSIFDWVRTEVEYVPYAGVRQSAEAAAASRSGNAIEKASLLGVLLEDAGYDWRFATGDMKLSIEEAERWLGINGAATIRDVLERSGLEVSLHPSSRNADSIVIEDHVWVQMQADFYPVAASAEDDTSTIGNTPDDPADRWLDLDPSITYRYKATPSNISSLTGLQPTEVIEVVEESTGEFTADTSGNFTEVSDVPTSALENLAIEAGDRVDQLVTDTGQSLSELLGTDRLLEMEQREILPGTLPGEVVGKVKTVDPENTVEIVDFFQDRRNRISIRVSDGILSKKWHWIGAPQTSVEPLTLSFMAVDDPENYPDIRTTNMDTALSVPHQVSPNGTDPLQPLFYVKPVLMIGSSPIAEASDEIYHFGEELDLELTVTGPGGSDSHLDAFKVTAGGVYVISANNILRSDNIEELTDDIKAITSRFELLQKSLDISAQSILQREQSLTKTTVAALEQYISYPSVRGVVVGLEPAIYNDASNGVRMAVRRFGKSSLLTSSGQVADENKAAARVLVDALEDLSNAAPLGTMGGHQGYQTPGRIFAIEIDETSQTYRRYEQGVLLSEVQSSHLPGSNHPVLRSLEEELLLGSVHISDADLYSSQGVVSALNPGFATVAPKAKNGVTSMLGFTAEDSAELAGWTPMVADQMSSTTVVMDPMEGTMIAPLQLVLNANGSAEGVTGELVSVRNRSVELAESTIGISQSMIPAVTAAALLNAPHLGDDSTWAANIPSALTMIHKTADSFIRPQITSFEAEVLFADEVKRDPIIRRNGLPIMNTIEIEDTVMEYTNIPDDLSFEAISSRTVDNLTVTFNPQEVNCEITPQITVNDKRKIVESFKYAELAQGNYRLETCLSESGIYELRAFGELETANLVSEPEIIEIEVDNTSPTVKLVSPGEEEVIEGIYSIRGTVNDDNFYEWYLSWKKASDPASSYQILNGYRDTNRFPGEAMEIAVIDTQNLAWKGDYNIALTGVDEAGNQHTQEIELTVSNDTNPPEIALTGYETLPSAQNSEEFGDNTPLYRENTYTLTLDASDNEDVHDRGLETLRVWIEEENAGPDAWSRELVSAEFDEDDAQRLVDQEIPGIEIDVSTLPVSSPSSRFVVKAEAVDHRGNTSTADIANLSMGNVLWSFLAQPASFRAKGNYPIALDIFMTREASWKFDIYPVDFITGEADYNELTRSFSSNGIKDTYFRQDWWGDYEDGTAVPAGPYEVVASITYETDNGSTRSEAATQRINVIASQSQVNASPPRLRKLHNERDPNTAEDDIVMEFDPNASGIAEIKTDFFIEQGTVEPIEVYGALGNFALSFLDGSFQERMPEFDWGYDDAFWAIEFKSASAEPFISDIQRGQNSLYNLSNRDNWKTIAWGTDYPDEYCEGGECDGTKSVKLADWDVRSLPLGYYDIRIWVTDGSNMVHHVVGGLKVVPKTTGGPTGPTGGPQEIGALTLWADDMRVPFNGFTAQITRDYNSKDTFDEGPLGFGWKLRGINLKIETYEQGVGEEDEAFVTLPDGREFWFSNVPPKGDNAGAYLPSSGNVWNRHGEYLQRPYGMRLYRPGGSPSFHNPGNDGILYQFTSPGSLAPGDPGRNIEIYYDHPVTGQRYPRGSVAYLQTEDKTWYVFQWKNGELLEIVHPDGQRTDFIYNNDTTSADLNNDPNAVSSEVLITDSTGKMLSLIRDSTSGRITAAIDPVGHKLSYEYDSYGNLSTVTDRSGTKRYYIYDTPESLEYFRANLPDEVKNITGNNIHQLIDVRMDNDTDGVSKFEGDLFPNDLDQLSIPRQREVLIASQNWPGDTSIMKFDFCGGDNICAYETKNGKISLEYEYEEDGSGEVFVVDENTRKRSRIKYNDQSRVEEKEDMFGNITKYEYGNVETSGAGTITGILTEITDPEGNKTAFEYGDIPQETPGSYAEIFEGFLNSKLSGDCPGLYANCQEEYIPQDTPGYLTGHQTQPVTVNDKGKSENQDEWIVSDISYNQDTDSLALFKPDTVVHSGKTLADYDYDPDTGKLSSIDKPINGVNLNIAESDYISEGKQDPVYGYIYGPNDISKGKVREQKSGHQDIHSKFSYRYKKDLKVTDTDSASPDFHFEIVEERRVLSSNELEAYFFTRYDANNMKVEKFSSQVLPALDSYSLAEDKENRVVVKYDPEGRVIERVMSGSTVYYNYDWRGLLVEEETISFDEEGSEVKTYVFYNYDELGTLLGSETRFDSRDNEPALTDSNIRNAYPPESASSEDILSSGYMDVNETSFGFTEQKIKDAGGRVTNQKTVDPLGRVLNEYSVTYNKKGQQENIYNKRQGNVRNVYDSFGRTVKKIFNEGDPNLEYTEWTEYNNQSNIIARAYTQFGQSYPSNWVVNIYNDEDFVERKYYYQSSPDPQQVTGNTYVEYAYDDDFRQYAERDITGVWTYSHFDEKGNVTAQIKNWKPTNDWLSNPETRSPLLESELPDRIKNSSTMTDQESQQNLRYDFEFDESGFVTKLSKPAEWVGGKAQAPSNLNVIDLVRDENGRIRYELFPVMHESQAHSNSEIPQNYRKLIQYTYGESNIDSIEYGYADSNLNDIILTGARIEYSYNESIGKLDTKRVYGITGVLNRIEEYIYDEITRELIDVIVSDDTGTIIRQESYVYETIGLYAQLIAKVTPEGTISYTYDDVGRLNGITSSTGFEIFYKYNERGNIHKITSPGISPDGSSDMSIVYEYDSFDRKTRVSYPNGASIEYSYFSDRGYWLSGITHKDNNGDILSLEYLRDDAGRITRVGEQGSENDYTWVYKYDSLGKIETAHRYPEYNLDLQTAFSVQADNAYEYKYDVRGNRIQKTVNGVEKWYEFNSMDQLISVYDGDPTGQQTQKLINNEWDTIGRLKIASDLIDSYNTQSYDWSGDDRLLSVSRGHSQSGMKIYYDYDVKGTRVNATYFSTPSDTNPLKKIYLTDYKNISGYSQTISETNNKSQVSTNFLQDENGQLLAQYETKNNQLAEDGFNQLFSHGDHLGSIRQFTDVDGDALLTDSIQYEPYGNLKDDSELDLLSLESSQLFTSQYKEANTSLQYNRARWYDANNSNWLSYDPVYDYPSNFGNPYAYAGNNPIMNHDPSGQFSLTELVFTVALTGVVAGIGVGLLSFLIPNLGYWNEPADSIVQSTGGFSLTYETISLSGELSTLFAFSPFGFFKHHELTADLNVDEVFKRGGEIRDVLQNSGQNPALRNTMFNKLGDLATGVAWNFFGVIFQFANFTGVFSFLLNSIILLIFMALSIILPIKKLFEFFGISFDGSSDVGAGTALLAAVSFIVLAWLVMLVGVIDISKLLDLIKPKNLGTAATSVGFIAEGSIFYFPIPLLSQIQEISDNMDEEYGVKPIDFSKGFGNYEFSLGTSVASIGAGLVVGVDDEKLDPENRYASAVGAGATFILEKQANPVNVKKLANVGISLGVGKRLKR